MGVTVTILFKRDLLRIRADSSNTLCAMEALRSSVPKRCNARVGEPDTANYAGWQEAARHAPGRLGRNHLTRSGLIADWGLKIGVSNPQSAIDPSPGK
jgi:hypothetical protein